MRPLVTLFLALALASASAQASPLPDRDGTPAVPSLGLTAERIGPAPHRPAFKSAASDTVYLYGAPGSGEGTFEAPDGLPSDQGWTGQDDTEDPIFWQVSTFNAANLNGHGVGNHAMWCGRTAAQRPNWATPPGYGNSWFATLNWSAPAPDSLQPTQVDWQMYLNHNSEPAYDMTHLQVLEANGSWEHLQSYDASNQDPMGIFQPPGVFFSASFTAMPDWYVDGEIHLRVLFRSDGAFSDQDGLWPTDGGVQVDDILVAFDGVPVDGGGDADGVATFENGDDEGWFAPRQFFVGDFSKVLPGFAELDPCRDNWTPQLTFIDDGTPPRNAIAGESTGGSTSPNWTYGPGGHVVNYTGGLFDSKTLSNTFVSPEIDWDLPGTADDGIDGGAFLELDVYEHQPLFDAIFWQWQVRSFDGSTWTDWQDRNIVYFGNFEPRWRHFRAEVRDLLVETPQKVQIGLHVQDYSNIFSFPGNDATPGPTFDNVSLARYARQGPRFQVFSQELFQDGFPQSGLLDYQNPFELWVRMDAAATDANNSEDAARIRTIPAFPGIDIAADPEMTVRLFANPAFDAVREVPGSFSVAGTTPEGWTIYEAVLPGAFQGSLTSPTRLGIYDFDVPGDGPARPTSPPEADELRFFFPGDSFHYYVNAMDTLGETATFPADITGFSDHYAYDRRYTVHALPSLRSDGNGGVQQPRILLVNDYGHLGEDDEWALAFAQNGLREGVDYDVFTVRAPDRGEANGIGAATRHGATTVQLAGYDCIFYSCGDLTPSVNLVGGDSDIAQDLSRIAAWQDLPGDRFTVYFGDNFVTGAQPMAASHVASRMGVQLVGEAVAGAIDGQLAPRVAPTAAADPSFQLELIADGSCPRLFFFDQIEPLPGAVTSHEFLSPEGAFGAYAAAAGVWHERTQNVDGTDYRRVDLTFPFSIQSIGNASGDPSGRSASAILLGEILTALGHATGSPTAAATPQVRFVLQNQPNPFSPRTAIRFRLAESGAVELSILDLRGRRVRQLIDRTLSAGFHEWHFDGYDDSGRRLASGVYLGRLRSGGETAVRKMVLIR